MYTIYIDIVELKSVTYPENSYTSIVILLYTVNKYHFVLYVRKIKNVKSCLVDRLR